MPVSREGGPARPGNGRTLPPAARMSRSCWFSRVSWLTARTRAGTSARSWASSLFLPAIVCLSLAMVARSRASSLVVRAAFPDALVELVLQVGVPLGERVAGDAGLDGERDDGQRAVGPLGGACQDAVHRGADPVALVGSAVMPASSSGGDAGAVVLVGQLAEPGGAGAEPVADGLRDVRGLAFEGERALAELGGLLVGAGDVAAAGDAAVEAGRVPHPVAVAEGPVALVVAEHEGVRVVVDHGVLVLQQLAGAGEGDGGADEAGRLGGGPDGAAGRGPGDAAAVLEVVVQGGDGVGDRAGGLQVDEVVDAVAAAGAVSLGRPVEGGAHVPVLDGQGDQPVGPAGDVPGQAPAEAAEADGPVRVVGDGLAGQAVAWLPRGSPRPRSPRSAPGARSASGSRCPAGRRAASWAWWSNSRCPSGTMRSRTRMALTTGRDGHPGDLALGAAGEVVAVARRWRS